MAAARALCDPGVVNPATLNLSGAASEAIKVNARTAPSAASFAGVPFAVKGVSDLPPGVKRGYPLARLTTIRADDRAELFAPVGPLPELEQLLRRAGAQGLEVGVVGSGSNALVADDGVPGLVVKSDKELSKIELHCTRIECGGGASDGRS